MTKSKSAAQKNALAELAAGKGKPKEVKRGPGRPPRADKDAVPHRIVARVSADLKEKLLRAKVAERRDMEAIMIDALTRYFDEKGY